MSPAPLCAAGSKTMTSWRSGFPSTTSRAGFSVRKSISARGNAFRRFGMTPVARSTSPIARSLTTRIRLTAARSVIMGRMGGTDGVLMLSNRRRSCALRLVDGFFERFEEVRILDAVEEFRVNPADGIRDLLVVDDEAHAGGGGAKRHHPD